MSKITFAIAVCLMMLVLGKTQTEAETIVFMSGNDLLTYCQDHSNKERRQWYCMGYMAGISDMLQVAGETCRTVYVNQSQMKDVVVLYLENHPATRHFTAATQTRVALTEAFPCPPLTHPPGPSKEPQPNR
jgi:hypothetical protein